MERFVQSTWAFWFISLDPPRAIVWSGGGGSTRRLLLLNATGHAMQTKFANVQQRLGFFAESRPVTRPQRRRV
jgi:hypothetical protein